MTFPEQQTPIVMLGMHRSGTSALAGALNYLGVDLGPTLLASSSDNELGFWEHAELVQLDEWILQVLGASWEDACALPAVWWKSEPVQLVRQAIADILEHDFSKSRLWGVKDPRLCRLLPLWNAVLAESGCKPLYVIVFRHPRAVAASLMKRDGFPSDKSHLLWLRYNLDAEYWTRGYRRVFVGYDDLLDNWRVAAAQIQGALAVRSLVRTPSVDKNIDGFLRPGLRHDRVVNETVDSGLAIDRELEQAGEDLYRSMQVATTGTSMNSNSVAYELDNVMRRRLTELVDDRCKTIVSGRAQQEVAKASKTLSAYLARENKNISLVIPTRNRQDKIVDCIGATYHRLAGPDTAVMIIRDCRRRAENAAHLEQMARRAGIDVIDYDPPFDVSVMSRPPVSRIYVIMHDFPCSYFAQLARYAKCRVMQTTCGVSFVLNFRE
jgi:hypothetical protein